MLVKQTVFISGSNHKDLHHFDIDEKEEEEAPPQVLNAQIAEGTK